MKGKYEVVVKSRRVQYKFSVIRNITILRGDSATGKTTLIDMIAAYQENGEASGVTALNLTWTELEDNCVRVETSPVLGVSGVWDYEIVYRDDTYYLINVDGKGEEYILK